MDKVKEFVVDYIQREYTVSDVDIMDLNYMESGYIDSMGLIQFIATIEDEFHITFDEKDMENPDIQVVGKLIAMIEGKMEAGKWQE